MALQESGEMYLETILELSKIKDNVRAIDISEYMNYSKPSVSRAMGILKKGEFINIDSDGFITLTIKGKDIAEKISERHTILSEFLIKLGVDKDTALYDACKIEHHISDKSFNALKSFIEKNWYYLTFFRSFYSDLFYF